MMVVVFACTPIVMAAVCICAAAVCRYRYAKENEQKQKNHSFFAHNITPIMMHGAV